jgi:hypothetical protein
MQMQVMQRREYIHAMYMGTASKVERALQVREEGAATFQVF